MCYCRNFCQIAQQVNCLRDLESFDVVRVSGMTRTYEFNANMYIYITYMKPQEWAIPFSIRTPHVEGTCS